MHSGGTVRGISRRDEDGYPMTPPQDFPDAHTQLPTVPPRRRLWSLVAVAGVGVLVIVAVLTTVLVMRDGSRAVSPAVAASATAIVADPAALDACDMANKVYSAPSGNLDLYTPAKTRPIGKRALQSSNTEVKRWGTEIIEKADAADAAVGRDAKFQANLAAGGAVTQFHTYCMTQKIVTP
jgi:hypothetical protein